MSIETAEGFIKKLNTDTAMQQKLQRLGNVDSDAMVRFAAGEGFTFTASDLSQSLKAYAEELDESSLEHVAGGFNPQPEPPGDFMTNYLKFNTFLKLSY